MISAEMEIRIGYFCLGLICGTCLAVGVLLS